MEREKSPWFSLSPHFSEVRLPIWKDPHFLIYRDEWSISAEITQDVTVPYKLRYSGSY